MVTMLVCALLNAITKLYQILSLYGAIGKLECTLSLLLDYELGALTQLWMLWQENDLAMSLDWQSAVFILK
jgi:hypothetical protein